MKNPCHPSLKKISSEFTLQRGGEQPEGWTLN